MTELVGDLITSGLGVEYAATRALHPLDLAVPSGSFVAVVGPSGAGKTTLLWSLAGALAPTTGTVTWRGQAVTAGQTVRPDIALMPHGHALATALTAAENIRIPLLAAAVAPAEADRRTSDALRIVGLEDSGDHLIEELSGGQQQRAALARVLARQVDLVLVDEPTSDLDASNRMRVVAALRAEAARGALVVMTTHDPEAAAEADVVLAIHEGVVGTPEGIGAHRVRVASRG